MSTKISMASCDGKVKLGDMEYGEKFTDAPNNPNCFYIKLNKNNVGSGITLNYPKGHSVVMNLKTGGIRAIPGSARVTPLNCEMEMSVSMNPKGDGILKDRC